MPSPNPFPVTSNSHLHRKSRKQRRKELLDDLARFLADSQHLKSVQLEIEREDKHGCGVYEFWAQTLRKLGLGFCTIEQARQRLDQIFEEI